MGLYLDVLVQAHNPCTQEAKISLGYHVNPDQPGLHGETLILRKGDEGKGEDQGEKVKVR